MTEHSANHNLVATFGDAASGRSALDALTGEGIEDSKMSYLARGDEIRAEREHVREDAEEVPAETAKGAAAGGTAGAVAGGAAGALISIAVPGIGPALGAGIWAAVAGGAAAGATAGGVWGGLKKMWDERYEDAIREGRALVGVHSDDEGDVIRARKLLLESGAQRVDRFDAHGHPVQEP